MNAIQRFYIAINKGIPDRIPVVPKIWVDLAANLTGTSLYDVIKSPETALRVIIEAGIMLELDAVRQFHFPERKIEVQDDKVYEIRDGRRIGKIDMKGGLITHLDNTVDYHLEDPYTMAHYHFWAAKSPIINKVEDVKRIAVPNKKFLKEIGWELRQKKMMKLAGDRMVLIGDCSSATLAFYECLRGMNATMFDLIEEPKLVHTAMEKGAEIAIEKGKFNIDIGLKVLRLNDSIANMSVISPQHFREFVKPHMKIVCDELHHYDPKVRIYCHICGNVLPIMEDLVDIGLDCIAPLDPLGEFTCQQARKHVGEKVSLMGGVNTLSFINNTCDEIIKEARICMTGAGKKGGFILGSGCVIPRSAKKENIEALVVAAKKYGVYQNGVLCS